MSYRTEKRFGKKGLRIQISCFLALVLIFFLSFPSFLLQAQDLPLPVVSIGISLKASEGTLASLSTLNISDGQSHTFTLPSGTYAVDANGAQSIEINGQVLTLPLTISSKSPLYWNARGYRGSLALIPLSDGRFNVVNTVGLEDYLRGIIKLEVNPAWPMEALKAQVIVCRTYTLKNLRRHASEGFDLCATSHCQSYGGINSEDPRCNRAIDETYGEILTYKGQLAAVYFHADSGGMTAEPSSVWGGETIPYLTNVREPFPDQSPYSTWKVTLSCEQIQRALETMGIRLGPIHSLIPVARDATGRVLLLRVEGDQGYRDIKGHAFRMAVGSNVLRSTLFDVCPSSEGMSDPSSSAAHSGHSDLTPEQIHHLTKQELIELLYHPEKITPSAQRAINSVNEDSNAVGPLKQTPSFSFTFTGRGWGHGIGLSQWGAKAMADAGWSCSRILQTYFPGTQIEVLQ